MKSVRLESGMLGIRPLDHLRGHRRTRTRVPGAALPLIFGMLAVVLGGCGLSSQPGGGSGSGPVTVVAAENFWGSIAAQVGGSHVRVTSLIRDPNVDPHSYEPTAEDARTVADARYVIINGAGYDPWADALLKANPVMGRKELTIGTLTGTQAGGNPHLWYNPDYVTKATNQIRDDLKALDQADAAAIDASAQTFLTSGLKEYYAVIAAIKANYAGTPVGATESIFSYMAGALGLRLVTPPSYLTAVSAGQDISATDEATVEQQIAQKQITILVYNSQNTPNNIQAIITKAKGSGIPVVAITETPVPATASFQDWQVSQLRSIEAALAQATGK